MYEYRVVRVGVSVGGLATKYPYHELRLVRCLVGGGHYAHSRGCTIIRRSGPRRGTLRLEAAYQAECDRLNAKLRTENALASSSAPHWADEPAALALCLNPATLW